MTGAGKSAEELLSGLIDNSKVIDLTHTLEPGMPAWPTQARYGSVVYESYENGDVALHSMITMSEHSGTHIDAPRHFIKGACPIDELPLKTVMGRGVRIDAAGFREQGLLELSAVKEFEKNNGPLRKGDIVMFRFGWDEKYHLQPGASAYLRDWPGLAKETAVYLAEKEVKAVGCDCLAIDPFGSETNAAHYVLLGRGIPVIENIHNLSRLPVFSYVIGLPNKFKGGSGSPIRLIAITEDKI
jgi:kynurenine formamidase